MSRPVRRPAFAKAAKAIASLLLLVLVAASCSSDGFPESYADQPQTLEDGSVVSLVELNWLEGCTVGLADSDLAEDANNVCRCSYSEISGPNGIPFAEFVTLNDQLKGDPSSLVGPDPLAPVEQRMLDIVRDCIAGG